jgi:nucleoid-associated protein YgaU
MFSFVKEAGEKLFGKGEAKATQAAATAEPTEVNLKAANEAAANAIVDYVKVFDFPVDGLDVGFDAATGTATVRGNAQTQEVKEKVLLCCGNVAGVTSVEDKLGVIEATVPPVFHTVVSGDSLSKIAKEHYGNAMDYPKIFEANKPMLTHPDKIYPGQVLRIPA